MECTFWTNCASKTKCDNYSYILRCKCECVLCLVDCISFEIWCDCELCLVRLIVSHLNCDVMVFYVWLCWLHIIWSVMWLCVMFGWVSYISSEMWCDQFIEYTNAMAAKRSCCKHNLHNLNQVANVAVANITLIKCHDRYISLRRPRVE